MKELLSSFKIYTQTQEEPSIPKYVYLRTLKEGLENKKEKIYARISLAGLHNNNQSPLIAYAITSIELKLVDISFWK